MRIVQLLNIVTANHQKVERNLIKSNENLNEIIDFLQDEIHLQDRERERSHISNLL